MSKKRAATSELTSENWNDDDPEEPEGTFKAVGPEVLCKREIKIARRRFSKPNTEQSKLFTNLSGFGKNSTPDAKNTFSFLSNLNESSSKVTNSSTASTMPSHISTATSNTTNSKLESSGKPSKEGLQSTKIKVLNECLVEWITKWVFKNPTCVLTPVFRDYEKHLETIKAEVEKSNDESKTAELVPSFKFNFTSSFNKTPKPNSDLNCARSEIQSNALKTPEPTAPASNGNWLKSGIGTLGENSLNNKPALFNFSSNKPSFLQTVGALGSNESTNNKEDNGGDDDPPLVNDFKPVTEDDALYSQRVKVFVKSNETYSDRGVGNLFIKETKNEKGDKIYQAIVRADTTLGNIIFNIRITKDIPTKRVGKNNVMLVCLPTPESKPPPVAVLLRVKTEEDADKLLIEINKYK